MPPAGCGRPPAVPERILIVDDDRDICRYVEVNLTLEGYDVAVEHDSEAAVAAALRLQPDLVLLDVMMPGLDGYEVCKLLRHDARTMHASIIMLTAKSLPADRVVGLTAGADDYIAKPFEPAEVVARVKSALRRSRQMREASPLTGMPGNFQISFELDRLMDQPRPAFALVHADLDNFKAYNDRYGFLRGDEAVKATARVITGAMSRHPAQPEFVGHIGGDDFAVITSPEVVEELAVDIVGSFDAMAPTLYDRDDRERGFIEVTDRRGHLHRYGFLSISLGVASTGRRSLSSRWEASSLASEMKSVAKRDPGSSYWIDRRRA
jgi:diguanylate cyclase (GGDEF)-like protein